MTYIGTPTSRVDGRAKVTGAAKYAGEYNTQGLAHAAVVTSSIAKGRIKHIDASEALRVKGVLDVLTHENRPRMAKSDEAYKDEVAPDGSPFRPLSDNEIRFNNQPIALVVAEEWEIARFAASLVRVEYKQEAHVTDLHQQRDAAVPLKPEATPLSPPKARGKARQAFAAAKVRHEAEYYVPIEHHNPMEPYASTVIYGRDGKLTIYDKTQGVQNVQRYVASVFEMKAEDVRVVGPYMGGGFGSGLRPQYQVVLAVLAARALKRDPVELRLRCYSDRDQHADKPYSSKKLRECYRAGAEAFGWDRRSAEPRSMREGSELIGWGMASGVWDAMQMAITVRIVLSANGHAEIACGCSDIGTGTHTIMAQVAADMLGLPLDSVTIKLGDSSLPASPVEGGSWMAASVGNGIAITAEAVRKELLRLAKSMPHSPLRDAVADDVALADGKLVSKRDSSRAVSITDAMRHGGVERIEQEKETSFPEDGPRAHNTHSAAFAEVKLDEELGVIRVTRLVSAIAAGRILNTKTATSQIMGGMVW